MKNTAVKDILITSDKHTVAFAHYARGHDTVVIIAHGFYNSKEALVLRQLAEALTDTRDVFMFDFRGHGESSGLFTWTSTEAEDLKAVLDYLDSRYAKKGIVAFSIGGSVSINLLSKYPKADSLICVGTPADFEKIDYHFWELDVKKDFYYTLCSKEGRKGRGVRPGKFWLPREKPIDRVALLSIPILYLHGDRDWVVRPWHSRSLYEKTVSRKKLKIIKDGSHAEYLVRDSFDELVSEIKNWFNETLPVEVK